uniref:HAD superfamily hydrolase, putative n=1 Tax=Babesia bovis TaxID=5865 RepID=S6AYZ8_BABBO|nr:HAD superfamily hydrolase, putative [Babesia bovis]
MLCNTSAINPCEHGRTAEERGIFRCCQWLDGLIADDSASALIANFRPLRHPLKYFAVDLDGTFLSNNPEVFQRNLDAFAKVFRAGYKIFFCTGRCHTDSMRVMPAGFMEKIGYNGFPGVYYNGGIVFDDKGNVIVNELFDKGILSRIIDCIIAANHEKYTVFLTFDCWYVVTDDRSYFNEMIEFAGLNRPLVRTTLAEVMKMDIMKVLICKYALMAPYFGGMVNHDFVHKRAMLDMTDLTPVGVTKRSGLEVLLDHLGGSAAECGYIGDAENDIEAMEFCDHSFAVGNATDTVKKSAKYVCEITSEQCAFAAVVDAVYGSYISR